MSNEQKSILIVDDDISLGEVLQQALRPPSYPYKVRLARDADEALAQISRRDFDLIITDIKMGGLSGLQLLEALRQVAPQTQTIAMTAFGSLDIKEQAQALGVFAYLSKPFTIQEFRQCIQNALLTDSTSDSEKLPASQSQSMNKTLAELRGNTGAHAVFFVQERNSNVLGVDSDTNALDLTSLSSTLVDITQRMTAEVAKVFGGNSGFQRMQYTGETFNLITYRLAGEGFLILVYDHRVKEGIISFYARQALEKLTRILRAETCLETPGDDQTAPQNSVMAESNPSSSLRPDISEAASEPMTLEQALNMGLLSDDFIQTLDE